MFSFFSYSGKVFAVDWSPDGEKVASGGRDRVLNLWMGWWLKEEEMYEMKIDMILPQHDELGSTRLLPTVNSLPYV